MGTEIDGVNGIIKNTTSDGDITIKGNDGGSEVSALILDMSDAGTATFNHDVKLGDNSKALFGAGSDLQIYHNGSDSYIDDNGTGDFDIRSNGTKISLKRIADGHEGLRYTLGGSLLIKHNNSTKLETTSTGVDITGAFTATAASTITTADNTDTLTLISTDTDSAIGPNLNLYRNAGNGADADNLSTIAFAGNDDAGNATDFARITAQIDDASNGSEDVYVHHRTMLAGTERLRMSLLKAETVFNEESQDLDFRVESNGNANMFVVDAGNDRVGVGTNAPARTVQIVDSSATPYLSIVGPNDAGAGIMLGDTDDETVGRIVYDNAANSMQFWTNDVNQVFIPSAGNLTRQGTAAVSMRIGSTNAGGAFLLLDGDSDGDFTGSDYSYIAHDSAGRLEIFQDSPSGTNQIRFHTAAVERMRLDANGELALGETAPDVDAGGITLNQGANDGKILTFKSSDFTGGADEGEADTFGAFSKSGVNDGGLAMLGVTEAGQFALNLKGSCDTASVTETTSGSGYGVIATNAVQRDGSGNLGHLGANANMNVFLNNASTKIIFKGDGEIFSDQSATVQVFDTYEDAQLVRAYELSAGRYDKGLIDSKFDEFVQYNAKDLADANLIGKEENGTPNTMVNITGMQRLHNGAIWQQYEKHQKLANAFYKLAQKTIGKEEADKLLTEEEIQLLN